MSEVKTSIVRIGTAVPQHNYQQSELADWMANALNPKDERLHRILKVLYKKTSIESRHSVLHDFNQHSDDNRLFKKSEIIPSVEERLAIYKKEVLQLSLQAVENCLAGFDQSKITHLIFVSCTGMTAPGVEIQLKKRLGLEAKVQTHAINFVGCYAAFPALKLAKSFCSLDENANVLIVSTELCTLHFQNKEEEDFILSNSLFSDGSAAVLVNNNLEKGSLQILDQQQIHIYQGKEDMAWDISSEGFLMKLSSYVPDLVNSEIKNLLSGLITKAKLNEEAIQHWAIHPGGRKILEVCEQELALKDAALKASYTILKQYGNMSAPTILFVLKEMMDNSNLQKGEHLFACGFGPGLTLEGSILKIN